MNKIETQLESMHSPIRPYLVRREDKVGCPLCNNHHGECQRHDTGVGEHEVTEHHIYTPIRVQVKFCLWFLGAVGVTVFIILCAAKAVR